MARPSGSRLRLAGADGRKVDHVARDVERSHIVAGVEPHAGGGAIGQFGGGDDVLPAQIERLAAELARDLVDQPLDGKAGARPRHAAIGAHRRLVGGDGEGFQGEMLDAIGAGQVARGHARFHERAGRPQRIGAGVDIDIAFDAEQRAVLGGRNGQIVEMIAGVHRGEQMLAAVLDPAHRMADLHGDGGDGDVLRHDAVLAAEAAADVGGDDADLVLRQAERLRHADPHHMAALGGQMDHQFVVAVVPVRQHAAAFERDGGLPVHAELAAQPHRRGGERDRIAFVHRAGDEGVVRPVVEHARAARPHRRDRVDHRRQRLELKLDQVGKVLGLGAGRLHAGDDRLADVAHPVVGQRRIGAVAMGGELRPGFQDVERADVGQREDLAGGARRREHAAHIRVRHVAADEGHVLHARHAHIGDEHAVAEQMPGILLAQHARSDPGVGRRRNGHVDCFPLTDLRGQFALRDAMAQAPELVAKNASNRPISGTVERHHAAGIRGFGSARCRMPVIVCDTKRP